MTAPISNGPTTHGYTTMRDATLLPGRGSSPLTRGKRTDVEAARLAYRLIPAHAGKTVPISSVMVMVGAHPRSRGENANTRTDALQSVGSSPLTRGKRDRALVRTDSSGLIPAHAGKTPPRRPPLTSTWAHPRSRGENCPKKCFRRRKCGSSPLTRGKRRFVGITTIKRGLIPAHAGKTIQGRNPSGPTRAHPRSRGENVKR